MIAFVIALVYNSAHRYSTLPSLYLSLSLSHTHTYVRELWHCSCARTSENASYENLCENACSFVAAKAHWTVQIASNLIFPFLFCFYSRNQLAAPIAHHTLPSSPTLPSSSFHLHLLALWPRGCAATLRNTEKCSQHISSANFILELKFHKHPHKRTHSHILALILASK